MLQSHYAVEPVSCARGPDTEFIQGVALQAQHVETSSAHGSERSYFTDGVAQKQIHTSVVLRNRDAAWAHDERCLARWKW